MDEIDIVNSTPLTHESYEFFFFVFVIARKAMLEYHINKVVGLK